MSSSLHSSLSLTSSFLLSLFLSQPSLLAHQMQKPLTDKEIYELTSSYPPITECEFRYSNIKCFGKAPSADDRNYIYFLITKSCKIWSLLSTLSHVCYINHHIPQIKHPAPTLAQWYNELHVYLDELDVDKIPYKNSESLRIYGPIQSFFDNANENFVTPLNARPKKKKGRFAYYYYVDPSTNDVKHLTESEARQLFCKKYEQSILHPSSVAKPVFERLWKICITRSRSKPIIFRGYNIVNNLTDTTHIADRYHDFSKDFSEIYCLAEMVCHYPDMSKCIWNREEPLEMTKIPKVSTVLPPPVIVYSNPHEEMIDRYITDGDEREEEEIAPPPKKKSKKKKKDIIADEYASYL